MTRPDIPTDRPLTQLELQALICQVALELDPDGRGYVQIPILTSLPGLGERLGLGRDEQRRFKELNGALGTSRQLSEFVNRLIVRGILSRAWEQSDQHYFVTTYGREALTDIATLLQFESTEFIETLQDSELKERCGDVLARTKHFDSMVRDAVAVLEDRLKKMPDVATSGRRRDVAVKALSPGAGAYTLGDDPGQQESAQLLYQGILGFYGNPFLHGLRDVEAHRARQIIGFIDNLLGLLRQAQRKDRLPSPGVGSSEASV